MRLVPKDTIRLVYVAEVLGFFEPIIFPQR